MFIVPGARFFSSDELSCSSSAAPSPSLYIQVHSVATQRSFRETGTMGTHSCQAEIGVCRDPSTEGRLLPRAQLLAVLGLGAGVVRGPLPRRRSGVLPPENTEFICLFLQQRCFVYAFSTITMETAFSCVSHRNDPCPNCYTLDATSIIYSYAQFTPTVISVFEKAFESVKNVLK